MSEDQKYDEEFAKKIHAIRVDLQDYCESKGFVVGDGLYAMTDLIAGQYASQAIDKEEKKKIWENQIDLMNRMFEFYCEQEAE